MPTGIEAGPPDVATLLSVDRDPGQAGPAPVDDRTEIRWARCAGDDVVVKAGSGELRDRLRREAEVLRRCKDLPVIDLVELAEGADHTELVTARYGSLTLKESGLLDPHERGLALAAACAAVEELHRAGRTHGALTASHVLVEPGGGVRLCSLGAGQELEAAGVDGAEASDRDALSTVVTEVLEQPAGFESGRERRRWDRAARRAVARLGAARGLRSGAEVLEVLRGCGVPGTDTAEAGDIADIATPPERRRRSGPSMAGVAVAAVVACLLSAGAAWALTRDSGESALEPICADIEADGACDQFAVEGQTITVGEHTFDVGGPGETPRLGDWNCDGTATVAVLRPTSGEVFTFDGWADRGSPVSGELVGTFEGATGIVEPTSCGPMEITLQDGSVVAGLTGDEAG